MINFLRGLLPDHRRETPHDAQQIHSLRKEIEERVSDIESRVTYLENLASVRRRERGDAQTA